MEVQVKEYKMKKKVVIIFSMIVGLKIVYIYVMFNALPLAMVFNVSCLRVDYSSSECQMDSMC